MKARGFEKIPSYGVEPVNVPGAVGGWMAMHERFGSMDLDEVMKPAIFYAENGFPVSPNISRLWKKPSASIRSTKIVRNSPLVRNLRAQEHVVAPG